MDKKVRISNLLFVLIIHNSKSTQQIIEKYSNVTDSIWVLVNFYQFIVNLKMLNEDAILLAALP